MRTKKGTLLVLVLSLIIGSYLRFYKLDWGEGYYFHPDEYHIVGAVHHLISNGLFSNPQLFSYGSLTVYLIYFAYQILSHFLATPNIFIIGRSLSALFSTLTLIIIFAISKKNFPKNKYLPVFVVLVSAFVPGMIQQAHYLTPETFITFWITLSTYFFIVYFEKQKLINLILSALSLGLAGGTKISAFAVLPFFLTTIFFYKLKKEIIFSRLQRVLLFLTTAFVLFFSVFPYSILDYTDFRSTTRYESSLATGATKVFYTRAFEGSIPFLFQITKIYPYTVGVVCLGFSIFGAIITAIKVIKNTGAKRIKYLILAGVFFSYFLFNGLLFTKWTRFIHPTIPFVIIFAFLLIDYVTEKIKNPVRKIVSAALVFVLVGATIISGSMYFTIYQRSDVRIQATNWAATHLEKNSYILTETGNTLEVPLKGQYNIIPFDFYNVDTRPQLYEKLLESISKSDYFIIQSRRIYLNHKNKNEYPVAVNFYKSLFSEQLGFTEIQSFESFPQLTVGKFKYTINDEKSEETWTVFDHPVLKIFKKTKGFSINHYDQILRQ